MAVGIPSHRRVRIVLHHKASDDERVRAAVKAARLKGHEIDVRVTWEQRDAVRFAAEAAQAAAAGALDVVVAGGGDGTINRVVRGALEAAPEPTCSFAVLPLGTANDFAVSAGVPANDITAALALATDGEARWMDLGALDGRVFVNLLSAGFGTTVTAETDPALKKLMGRAAYLVSGLNRFTEIDAVDATFHGDGFSWDGRFAVLAVGNGRQAGGGITLCPDALVDDGFLDVSILPALDGQVIADGIAALLEKGARAIEDVAVQARVRRLEVRAPQALHVNLDGEPTEAATLTIACLAKAIRFHFGESELTSHRQPSSAL